MEQAKCHNVCTRSYVEERATGAKMRQKAFLPQKCARNPPQPPHSAAGRIWDVS
jgi:hypothetical protein